MKPEQQAKVDKYVGWAPDALETRIKWRTANMQADQQEIAAMRKAQRIQRKKRDGNGKSADI